MSSSSIWNKAKKSDGNPTDKKSFTKQGFTPVQIIHLVERGKVNKPEIQLNFNRRRAGIDPTSKHYGLLAANLFPAKDKLEFTSEKFNFLLEKPRGGYLEGAPVAFQDGGLYNFNAKWDKTYVTNNPEVSEYNYPRSGEFLTINQNTGHGNPVRKLRFKVIRVDIPPGMANFGLTMRFERV
jgi:hypothetical protein